MRHSEETIKNGLRNAVTAQTPDVLPRVLRQIHKKKGLDEPMDTAMTIQYPAGRPDGNKPGHKKTARIIALVASIAAVFTIVAGVWFGIAAGGGGFVVSLDVNPSIELHLDGRQKVVSAAALNPEAQQILGEMDLRGVDLEVAVNALMGSMLKNGYISSEGSTILISVESGDEAKGKALQQQLAREVDGILSQLSVKGAVLSQSLSDDEQLRALAQQYGISLGKAALIDLLANQDPLLDRAQLAQLSVNDIYLLLSSKQAPMEGMVQSGQPSAGAYIGEEAAKSAALAHAGVAEQDVTSFRIELDFDDGRMIYEVEWQTATNKYEYGIDAVSGAVLDYEWEGGHAGHGGTTPAGFIGEEAAKAIALGDAGLAAQDVRFAKCEWYEKQGTYRYDVVFLSATHKYQYDVNAYTGEIIASHVYERDGADPSSPGGASADGYIGEAQAKSIALAHANVLESALQRFEIELKRDDGRWIYEVEFTAGGIEYDYDIDAFTGAVLKAESERD